MKMTTTHRLDQQRRAWSVPRPLLDDHIGLLLLVWAGFLVAVMTLVFAVARFRDIEISGWEVASGISSWYVGGVAGYLLYQALPLLVAHGRTRRDAAIEVAIVLAALIVVAAILMVAGYLVEYVVYGVAGWPRELSGEHLFSSHTDVPMIFVAYGLTFLVWGTAGAIVGAAVYRYKASGWLALAPASLLISLIGFPMSPSSNPVDDVIERVLMVDTPSLPLAIVIAVVCVGVALAMTWSIIRDVPLRNI